MESDSTSSSNSSSSSSSECSMWVEMAPDVLANIFARLPLHALLTVIPCVCKPWMRASLDPLCWQILDLRRHTPIVSPRLLQVLLQRTQGQLREFIFPEINLPDCLELLASSAPVLQKLHIPYSCASNEWAISAAPLMPGITDLNLSNIKGWQLSHKALEAFGKHCRGITHLRKNEDWHGKLLHSASKDDSDALVIAQNYPSLKHLELRHNPMSTLGVRAILNGCAMLEHLDLTACVLDMDEGLLRECRTRLQVFCEPWRTDEVNNYGDDSDNDEEYSDDDFESGTGWCLCCNFEHSGFYNFCEFCICHGCHNKEHFDKFDDAEDDYEVKDEEDDEGEDEDEDEDAAKDDIEEGDTGDQEESENDIDEDDVVNEDIDGGDCNVDVDDDYHHDYDEDGLKKSLTRALIGLSK